MEKSFRARPRQWVKAEPRVVPPLIPTGLILRTVADQEEQTTTRQTLHEGVQDGLGLGVNPMKVLEDDHQRLHVALEEQEPPDAFERALPTFHRIQLDPLIVVDRDVEERQERR
jgi:hypothetical protein